MRERFIRPAAVAVSLAIHGAALWNFSDYVIKAYSKPEETKLVTRISFKKQEPKVVEKPKPAPKPKPRPKPKPKPRPKPKHEPKPEPKPEPEQQPEPLPEPEPEPVVEPVEPEPVSMPVAQTAPPPVPPKIEEPPVDFEKIEREKRRYLAEVLGKIEKNKYYPRAARRRGMQGLVRVSFTILDKGGVRNIRVKDAPGVLMKAAEKAVLQSVPLPSPPDTVFCPLEIEYAMEFKLK